jgi:putative membrane protein
MYGGARRRPTWMGAVLVGSTVLVGVVVLVFLLALTGAFGTTTGRPWFGVFGGLFLVFLVLWVAFFVFRIVFWSRRNRGGGPARGYGYRDPAVAILRQRYARGEITREQYDRIMTDLERRRLSP